MTISIVLYGRNDNYGYNLHKRAALSLNCMAEVLTDTSDEILFVDYNTPDDFPTFPEAIQDTLTKRARNILRIFRVRPRIHQRFKSRTRLVALEPIARNVAIRRSSAANRWILSTNTDMIFVPQGTGSLSRLARDLAPGFYHAPRIEIPEVLWESFDRQAPAEIIKTIREWGSTLHLNEIILGSEYILYDGPGDFQLLLRDDLFAHHGFHEGMLLGWHVDSNIARRMYVKYGAIGDLGTHIYGYHCDHTRQVTPAHSHRRLQNDWRIFCDQVDTADVPEQADTWGCPNDSIEELGLVSNPASVYVGALRESVGSPLREPRRIKYTHETFNKIDYDPSHVLPFLADLFVPMPRAFNVAWFGVRREMLSKFATVWKRLAFAGKILVDDELIEPGEFDVPIESDPTSQLVSAADVFVFDFGGLPAPPKDIEKKQVTAKLLHRFVQVVREERCRCSAGLGGRRIVALNAINNHFEWLVRGYVAAAATPCGTYMRHGFVLPAEPKEDWLPLLYIGQAGIRSDAHLINSDPRNLGVVTYGPYRYLDPGYYRLAIGIELAGDELEGGGNEPCIAIEVRVGPEVLAVHLIRRAALRNADHDFYFKVTRGVADVPEGIETRITLFNHILLSIRSLTVESMPSDKIDTEVPLQSPAIAFHIEDWLPYLSIGPLGQADDTGVVTRTGPPDFVVYGPHWPLPPGHYEAILSIEALEPQTAPRPATSLIRADVVSGEQQLAAAIFHLNQIASPAATPIRLPFEMPADSSTLQAIETRVWSSGGERFRIRRLAVLALELSTRRDLIPFLLIGEAGQRFGAGIRSVAGRTGTIAYTPTMRIKAGFYKITFEVAAEITDQSGVTHKCCAIAQVSKGSEFIAVKEIPLDADQTKDQQLMFAVPLDSGLSGGIEFALRSVSTAKINLRALTLEPAEKPVEGAGFAPLAVSNWLPYLQTGTHAHADLFSIVVDEGEAGFAVYGPYWTLPAGHYELRASIIPHPENAHPDAVVRAQVSAELGARILAETIWRLNRYRLPSTAAAAELRIPFYLSDNLSPAARTIETRIFTRGDIRFRIVSLSVMITSAVPESDWFPYLTVEECGFHTGTEIKSLQDKAGYVASTSPMSIGPGHYRLSSKVSGEVSERHSALFEVRCGLDVLATEIVRSDGDHGLEFDLPHELSGQPVEVRIRVIEPTSLAVHSLALKKLSESIDPGWRERLSRAQRQSRLKRIHVRLKNLKDPTSFLKFALLVVRKMMGHRFGEP